MAEKVSYRAESSAIHTLHTTALPELLIGWGIVFVSSLLTLHDAFDLFTDILVKTANWYIAAAANLLWLAFGLLILARRLSLRTAALGLLLVLAFGGLFEIVLMAGGASQPPASTPVWERPAGAVAHGETWVVVGDERLAEVGPQLDAISRVRRVRVQARTRWSTADQIEYLRAVDLDAVEKVVLVWNFDDPDVDRVRFVELTWQQGRRFAPAQVLFPRTWKFSTFHLNRFLETRVLSGYGEANWRRRLYDSDNLDRYRYVVAELAALARRKEWNLSIVLLPAPEDVDPRYPRALAIFDEVGLTTIDAGRWEPLGRGVR